MLKLALRTIMIVTFALAVFGVMVISYASKSQGLGPYHYCIMQSAFLGLGVLLATGLYFIDYRFYRRPAVMWTLFALMVCALVAVFVPGLGRAANGARRWINLGPFSLQPIEFVKLFIIVVLSAYLEVQGGLIRRFGRGFAVPMAIVAVPLMLTLAQPDFGGSFVYCALCGLTLLLGGVSIRRCLLLGVIGVAAIGILVALNPNRRARLRNEANNENDQAIQSEIAFRNGGLRGVGIGQGMQKEYYLPECHTDFIFAVVAEDMGLVATGGVWLAYLLLLSGGATIAFRAKDKQGTLLAFGATMLLCAQGAANMAVVTHLFPTKGLALPFLSYGGSCLLASFSAVGILLGVGRVTLNQEIDPEANTLKPVSFTV